MLSSLMYRRDNLLIASVVLLTVVGAVLLVANVPTVQRIPGWVWPIRDPGTVGLGVIAAVAFSLPLLVMFFYRADLAAARRGAVSGLIALMLFGLALQHGLALMEMRGINGLRDRILRTGHAEFARTASLELGYWRVLTQYEQLLRAGNQSYARSKPPGQLLFYMSLSSIADSVMPQDPTSGQPEDQQIISERHRRLVDLATIVLPLLSVLTVVPLYFLARVFLPNRYALWPPLFYILAPPVALVTLHLDQALYPLLATTIWAFAAIAGKAERRSWVWGTAAGLVTWLALFISFSLLPVIPLAALLAWLAARGRWSSKRPPQLVLALAGFALAFFTLTALARFAAGYDMIHRYRTAMGYHRAWMAAIHPDWAGWPEALGLMLKSSLLNLVEFGYWLGPPLLVFFLFSVLSSIRNLRRLLHDGRWNELLGLGTLLLLLGMAWFGGSIGETARLWIFMIPPVAITAVHGITRLNLKNPQAMVLVVGATQFAWMFLLKAKQDFW